MSLAPIHHVIVVGPFSKWGINFMTYKPCSSRGHGHMFVAVDYFTKWAEVMPKLKNTGETTALFFLIMSYHSLVFHEL